MDIGVGRFGSGLTPRAIVVGMAGRLSFKLVEYVSSVIVAIQELGVPHP